MSDTELSLASEFEPDTGRIEVLVRHGVGPLCRLGLTVEGDNVAFSLDALDQGEPPPIHAVVRRLADALERGARRPNR